jgi:hypothetical protein
VITYSSIIEEMDAGELPKFNKLPAPHIAKTYWKLGRSRVEIGQIIPLLFSLIWILWVHSLLHVAHL